MKILLMLALVFTFVAGAVRAAEKEYTAPSAAEQANEAAKHAGSMGS
ncbi:hypothetical protein HQN60_10375 [Deefgea piscis]|uniref:Uncharacterized protein n=1 Tax=Deefgea piscis TaxID=2739061 RepID=A0A6M8SSM0_9NEIS|nr:hypothetical protein [Deefgea piscis]QKJ67068.1 hypothetical protein HQN60_10375 [Deefgea piscis]